MVRGVSIGPGLAAIAFGRAKGAKPRPPAPIPPYPHKAATSPTRIKGLSDAVYPRVGGGNLIAQGLQLGVMGLSPRGRGKPVAAGDIISIQGSIPAWAGETTDTITPPPILEVYPRVGGGNTPTLVVIGNDPGLSPRGRGKHPGLQSGLQGYGSIPAWAGETPALDS